MIANGKFLNFRKSIFSFALRGHPPGEILSFWRNVLHWALFPLVSFYCHMQAVNGYDITTNSWNIYGVEWDDKDLHFLSKSDGCVSTIKISNGRACLLSVDYELTRIENN